MKQLFVDLLPRDPTHSHFFDWCDFAIDTIFAFRLDCDCEVESQFITPVPDQNTCWPGQ